MASMTPMIKPPTPNRIPIHHGAPDEIETITPLVAPVIATNSEVKSARFIFQENVSAHLIQPTQRAFSTSTMLPPPVKPPTHQGGQILGSESRSLQLALSGKLSIDGAPFPAIEDSK